MNLQLRPPRNMAHCFLPASHYILWFLWHVYLLRRAEPLWIFPGYWFSPPDRKLVSNSLLDIQLRQLHLKQRRKEGNKKANKTSYSPSRITHDHFLVVSISASVTAFLGSWKPFLSSNYTILKRNVFLIHLLLLNMVQPKQQLVVRVSLCKFDFPTLLRSCFGWYDVIELNMNNPRDLQDRRPGYFRL